MSGKHFKRSSCSKFVGGLKISVDMHGLVQVGNARGPGMVRKGGVEIVEISSVREVETLKSAVLPTYSSLFQYITVAD